MKTRVLLTAAALALAAVAGNAQQTVSDGLGTVHFPISCTAVQAKFERAVALLHNFHYPETVKAFQAVIKDDPDCGARVFTSNLEAFLGMIFVTLGSLDNPEGIDPVLEMFTKRRLKWAKPP